MTAAEKVETKPKLALYWAASCGGCEIAVLDIREKILDVDAFFDVVFWPVAVDFKVKDVEAMDDGEIDLCLFNGAVRTSDNEYMAQLLRRKSKVLVAFGSCACEGCIPALSNTTTKAATFDWVYSGSPSTVNPEDIRPQLRTQMPVGELDLPEFWETVHTLDQTVEVDYYVPGCPPQAHQIWAVLETVVDILANDKPLPPKGAVLGADDRTCCDECPRVREEKKVTGFRRIHEFIPDPEACLLDQGVICLGPATRAGCGGRCVSVGVACRGCYGPAPNSQDQGTKMIAALASVIDSQDPVEIDRILDGIVDPVGTFYRFSMARATLAGVPGNGSRQPAQPDTAEAQA